MLAGQNFGNVGEVFNNGQLQGLVNQAFSAGSGVMQTASAAFDSAYQSLSSACKAAFDFVKFDIFTTFFQQIGLWFTKLDFPALFEKCFKKIMEFVSLLWDFWSSITELHWFAIYSSISVVLLTIWIIQKRSDPKKLLTGPNTYGWEERGTLWLYWTRFLVTILTFLYLPCMTGVFNVMFCMKELMIPHELTCYEGIHWLYFVLAFFVFIYMGLYFPWQIFLVINEYKPVPQTFDDLGNPLNQDLDKDQFLAQYVKLMERDKCPYLFLYSGYEYGWSAYKVVTMVVKMLLVIPCSPLIPQGNPATAISLAIVTVYAIISCIWHPFILDQDDWIDICARITAVSTLVLQICKVNEAFDDEINGILLTTINILNLVIMVLVFVCNMDITKDWYTKNFGTVRVSPGLAYPLKSRLIKIWKRFWLGLLQSCGTLQPVYDRVIELEDLYEYYGEEAYNKALGIVPEEILRNRRIASEFEGVDVFWHGNKQQPNDNYWGRMYIEAFPFSVNVIYDATGEHDRIYDGDIGTFLMQNQEHLKNRQLRQYLRVLSGEQVVYPFKTTIKVGKGCFAKNREVQFNYGKLYVKTLTNDPMCHGFTVYIDYDDGETTDGAGNQVQGICHRVTLQDLGIDNFDFKPEGPLYDLVTRQENHAIIARKWDEFILRNRLYREDMTEWRLEDESIASYGFMKYVINNDNAPISVVNDYIQKYETNPELKALYGLYKSEFDALQSRLTYYDSHPAIALWYNFWDDVAVLNASIKQIQDNPDLFDLTQPTALIYHPCTIDQLKRTLEERGLRKENGSGFFGDEILNQLEAKLEEKGMEPTTFTQPQYVTPIGEAFNPTAQVNNTPLITENCTFIASAAMMVL